MLWGITSRILAGACDGNLDGALRHGDRALHDFAFAP